MAGISHTEVLMALLGWLFFMVFVGMIWIWGWVVWRLLTGRRVLPEEPMVSGRRAPWGVGTVVLVLLLYVAVNFASQWGYLWASGRLPKKGLGASQAVAAADPTPVPKDGKQPETHPDLEPTKPLAAKSEKDRESLRETEVMFLVSVIDSALLVLIPLLVRLVSGARLRDLGVGLNGWVRQAAVGIGATLFVAPIIYLIQLIVIQIWPPDPSNDHPLMTMLKENFSAGVVYLAFVSAVILAPMLEELMFRAILQGWLSGWLARRRNVWRRPSAKPAAPVQMLSEDGLVADYWKPDDDFESKDQTADQAHEFSWPAIVLTSLFFATVHLPQWPAPIAIFFLSLALGTVYQRTGSLIASCFMHATFNGLSTIAAIGGVLASQGTMEKKEKKLTSTMTIEQSQPVALGGHWIIEAINRR